VDSLRVLQQENDEHDQAHDPQADLDISHQAGQLGPKVRPATGHRTLLKDH
jgi:hypothetical protein